MKFYHRFISPEDVRSESMTTSCRSWISSFFNNFTKINSGFDIFLINNGLFFIRRTVLPQSVVFKYRWTVLREIWRAEPVDSNALLRDFTTFRVPTLILFLILFSKKFSNRFSDLLGMLWIIIIKNGPTIHPTFDTFSWHSGLS